MIWLEARISQGRRFSVEDEHELASLVEDAVEIPPSRVFCEVEDNLSWCYILIEETPRVPVNRLQVLMSELRRAFDREAGRSLDEVNVIDPVEVNRQVGLLPELTRAGSQ